MNEAEPDSAAGGAPSRPANRLAREQSPYLLQHQFNPVDWHAWNAEAFAQAAREDKPIFLSIGYSTCHWCHVMERESFENEDLARILNRHFINIKLDREERPDVDRIYMTFVQATTGQGGWPLNVFLTPDLKPFFGGTYFPPAGRAGRPGFGDLLEHIQRLWATRREELVESAARIHEQLHESMAGRVAGEGGGPFVPEVLARAAARLKETYDPEHGGFGGAPKFPQPSQPRLLLRCAKRFNDQDALRMVLHTCDHMAAGGIHDHLGGGFARYAVDEAWRVPHFEKMLYDNAQLAQLYLDAYLVSGQARYAETARDILDYVRRDMTHPQGGFYSAEDADSEGHEGKFYCWTRRELAELLPPQEFETAARCFGITEEGNFVDHSHPAPLSGQNVLNLAASEEGSDPGANQARLLASAKEKLRAARARRVRPGLDDKILASWNGLMLGAFARAGAVLDEPAYRAAAERNLAFIKANLWDASTRSLSHRWRGGERDSVQLLEGSAFVLSGVIDLYETTLDPAHLEFALALAESMLDRFYDAENGGFWQSPADARGLILRAKETYDGAQPSGNSVAVLALLKLGRLTGRNDLLEAATKTLGFCAGLLRGYPQAVPCLLEALDFHLDEPRRAVIAGDPGSPGARALLRAVHSVYQPNKLVLGNAGPVESFAKTLPAQDGAVLYLCAGAACQPPTIVPATAAKMMG